MFDVLQISWWFLQVTLVGYLCTCRVFDDDTDRLLFAPVTGLAALIVVANLAWMWTFPTYLTSYILVVGVAVAVILVVRSPPRPSLSSLAWLVAGMVLVAMHGSLIPFEERLFQAYPLDRFGYLISYVLFQQENLSYFTTALTRLASVGENQVLFLHPMITAAFNEMQARTGAGLAFISLAWLTPGDLHRLGNAWEVFVRAVQFSSVFALFSKGLPRRTLAGFLAISVVFGYWFQYMKDYNAWPHMVTLALVIAIVALLVSILNKGRVEGRERYLIYVLALAMVVNHPEFGLVLSLGLGVVVCSNALLRKEFLLRKSAVYEGAGFLAMVFLVHPFIISWIRRVFTLSPLMINGESSQARGIYRLFGTDSQLHEFVSRVVAQPFHLLIDPVALADMAIGTTGFSFVTYIGATVTLGATFMVLALMGVGLRHQADTAFYRIFGSPAVVLGLATFGAALILSGIFWPDFLRSHALNAIASVLLGAVLFGLLVCCAVITKRPSLRVLFVLTMFHFVFFVGSLLCQYFFGILGPGSAYRSLPYWGAFASMALMLLLASSEITAFELLAGSIAVLNLIFGASIYWVTTHGGMETYPDFYTNHTGVRHLGMLDARSKYDFNYLGLVKPLSKCNLVFLDFKETGPMGIGRYHAANLMIFLENNHVRFRLGFPYLNAYQLTGSEYYPGFKKEEVGADCFVDQELRDGRLSYRLSVKEWR
jgi:hypothetical protein